jgi:protein-tyrosine phosphatase
MFPWRKPATAAPRGWKIVDIHSHLLPGLDDGPPTLDASLDLCRVYMAEGVGTVVATPHMRHPRFRVDPQDARQAAARLRGACRELDIELEILLGADVRLTPELVADVECRRVLTVAERGECILLELPDDVAPRLGSIIFDLAVRGVRPVLTHPERNRILSRRPARVAELVEAGCLVQVTGAALTGEFGRGARKAAERLLKDRLVHVVASDAHSAGGCRQPHFGPVIDRLCRLVGQEHARSLVCGNPAAIARGESVGNVAGTGPGQRQRQWEE